MSPELERPRREMSADLTGISPLGRTDYRELISPVAEPVWPEFVLHDPIANERWDDLLEQFGEYHFALLDGDGETVVAVASSVPVA
jgi:hypothetical protein